MIEVQEILWMKQDYLDWYTEHGFVFVYKELNPGTSTIDYQLGDVEEAVYTDTELVGSYLLSAIAKQMNVEIARFVPDIGGDVFIPTLAVENAGITLRPQKGILLIEGREYEIMAVIGLPEIQGESIEQKVTVRLRRPAKGAA